MSNSSQVENIDEGEKIIKEKRLSKKRRRREMEKQAKEEKEGEGGGTTTNIQRKVPSLPPHQQNQTFPSSKIKKFDNNMSINNVGGNNQLKVANLSSSSSSSSSSSLWSFEVDYNDHFETPLIAYQHLLPILNELCLTLNKPPSELIIYDPYYCCGNMKSHLASLGFTTVVNNNRDFYNDIKLNNIPAYDILVTNPPYSGEHKPKLLQFLLQQKGKSINNVKNNNGNEINSTKPFALLLPVYTATKSYWREFVDKAAASDFVRSCFYVMPPDSYEYTHPEGTGKEAPPFYSSWFVCCSATIQKRMKNSINMSSSSSSSSSSPKLKSCLIMNSIDELVKNKYVVEKRPNPKQRKKNMKKMMQQP